jgi:tocopherol cyclase
MTQVMPSWVFYTACMIPTIGTHAENERPPPPPTKQQSSSPPPLLSSQTLVLQKRGNPLQKSAMSTTPARETRSPHSGYHFDGSSREFFEGWYFKVSIPEVKQSFAWMYVSENPGSAAASSKREGGARGPSSAAQIMGANDEYLFQDQPSVKSFWGHRHELALGNTFRAKCGALPPVSETSPTEFWELVEEGYQATPTLHQGILFDDGGYYF